MAGLFLIFLILIMGGTFVTLIIGESLKLIMRGIRFTIKTIKHGIQGNR